MNRRQRLAIVARSGLRRVGRRVREALREWNGDADYERYLRRCSRLGEVALDRRRYFAHRLEEHYRASGRCC